MKKVPRLRWLGRIGLLMASALTLMVGVLVPSSAASAAPIGVIPVDPGLQTGMVDIPAAFCIYVTGGVAPYTFSATGLPPGKAIESATGCITGTPTVAGDFRVTVTVIDSVGQSGSMTFGWTILPVKPDVPVPDLTLQSVAQARGTLSAVGLVLGSVVYHVDCLGDLGVTSQNPLAGAVVPLGTADNICDPKYALSCDYCPYVFTPASTTLSAGTTYGAVAVLPKKNVSYRPPC